MPSKGDAEPVGEWRLVCSWTADNGTHYTHHSPLMFSREAVLDYQRYHRATAHEGSWLQMTIVRYSDGRARDVDVWHPSTGGDHRWHGLDSGRWRSSEPFTPPAVVLAGLKAAQEVLATHRPDAEECTAPACTRPVDRYSPEGKPWCEEHLPHAPPAAQEPEPDPELGLDPERPFTEPEEALAE